MTLPELNVFYLPPDIVAFLAPRYCYDISKTSSKVI